MNMDLFDVKGKVVIVTGASRGLGKAMALGLAKAGARIVLTDILDVDQAVAEVKEYDDQAVGLIVDITDKSDVDSMVDKTVDRFGRIDVLINNAGILKSAPAEQYSEKDWKKILDVNLTGQFLCAKQVGKYMIKQQSGRIINISSIAGLAGYESSVGYSASKAGVISLTKTLACEWGEYNVLVNAVCPGVFATDMTADYLKDEDFKEMIQTKIPLQRYANPDELVGTIIYLSSEASKYVTGHSLVIDGGWTAAI